MSLSNYEIFKIRSEQIKSGRHRDEHGDFIDETPVPCGCCGKKPIKSFIEDTLSDAVRFPLHLRVAVKLVAAGYTEADFHKAVQNGDFSLIPMPFLLNVQSAVRDIERKTLPKMSNASAKRLVEIARNL